MVGVSFKVGLTLVGCPKMIYLSLRGLQPVPARRSVTARRRGNLGRLLLWIPAFAGMTVSVSKAIPLKNGIQKRYVGAPYY